MEKEKIKEHFDDISKDYDIYKKRNKFYYKALKRMLVREVGFGKKVLDVGCGTGELLDFLKPSYGLGIDVSEGMIEKAKEKYDLDFKVGDVENLEEGDYDFVLLVDVVEHLSDVRKSFNELRKFKKVLVSFVNPLFEPLLMIMEKLKLKMEEGPHNRISIKEMKKIFRENGFRVVKEKYELFGLIKYFVLEK
ncbi:hypothetical protein CL618_02205 [archaeon]|nr:hypothetical protein [archaeon]|tara:strand:- start:5710 stop:6285 length:576 start_codon:yes stop_codon:yes gene_type:complete